jgi:hypothetical protein
MTLEVELDVDVPDGVRWSDDMAAEFEEWLATDVLNAFDGRTLTLRGVPMRLDGHSVTRINAAWPYR